MPSSSLAPAPFDFQQRVRKALKCWHNHRPQDGLLDDLLIAQHTTGAAPDARRLSTNQLLEQGMHQLARLSPADAELLSLRFCTCLHVNETRQQMHYAESTIYYKQNQAIVHLADILYHLETAAWQERRASLEGRLDAPPALLIGVEEQITRLAAVLLCGSGPWLLSIEGIGGIGKTTLAAAVLRHLAATTAYAGFGWVSAQVAALDLCGDVRSRPQPAITSGAILAALVRQLLPDIHPALAGTEAAVNALRVHLHRRPHVIVVDNWETVIDPQALLPILHSLTQPSRFILTSRRRLIAESNVYLHQMPELSLADSLLLMRHLVQLHNLAPLRELDAQELTPVYTAVGGNPLALMLVVNQMHMRPLRAVLADLAQVRTAPIEALFAYILHQTWMGLGERERRILKAMPAAELRCLDAAEIGSLCGLEATAAADALGRLVQVGFVRPAGDLDGCRYLLHGLTRTFVRRLADSRPGSCARARAIHQ